MYRLLSIHMAIPHTVLASPRGHPLLPPNKTSPTTGATAGAARNGPRSAVGLRAATHSAGTPGQQWPLLNLAGGGGGDAHAPIHLPGPHLVLSSRCSSQEGGPFSDSVSPFATCTEALPLAPPYLTEPFIKSMLAVSVSGLFPRKAHLPRMP